MSRRLESVDGRMSLFDRGLALISWPFERLAFRKIEDRSEETGVEITARYRDKINTNDNRNKKREKHEKQSAVAGARLG